MMPVELGSGAHVAQVLEKIAKALERIAEQLERTNKPAEGAGFDETLGDNIARISSELQKGK